MLDHSVVKKGKHCVLSCVCWQVELETPPVPLELLIGETDESHLMCMSLQVGLCPVK